MTELGIRKVAMPPSMIEVLKEHAWRNRLSVSRIARDILEDYCMNSAPYRALPDMEGTFSGSLTMYVPDDLWHRARDIAYVNGRGPVSAIIRKGFVASMGQEDIPAQA